MLVSVGRVLLRPVHQAVWRTFFAAGASGIETSACFVAQKRVPAFCLYERRRAFWGERDRHSGLLGLRPRVLNIIQWLPSSTALLAQIIVRLEVVLQPQLHDARFVGRRHLTEGGALRIEVNSLKVRVIENIERFNPELEH